MTEHINDPAVPEKGTNRGADVLFAIFALVLVMVTGPQLNSMIVSGGGLRIVFYKAGGNGHGFFENVLQMTAGRRELLQ